MTIREAIKEGMAVLNAPVTETVQISREALALVLEHAEMDLVPDFEQESRILYNRRILCEERAAKEIAAKVRGGPKCGPSCPLHILRHDKLTCRDVILEDPDKSEEILKAAGYWGEVPYSYGI